nr:hypothetical protein HUO10_003406 [Paraburkholderia busanensis]
MGIRTRYNSEAIMSGRMSSFRSGRLKSKNMSTPINKSPLSVNHLPSLLPALFLLTYPSATLMIQGAGSALSIAAAVIALVVLFAPRSRTGLPLLTWDRADIALCICGFSPILAVLLSGAYHHALAASALDSPARFVGTALLFVVLRRTLPRTLAWSDLSFALAALASLAVLLFASRDWGAGRLSSKFLNPIHFGDIALIMGVLSVLSLNWWRKDGLAVRVVKVAGLFAGLTASLITGSRGGWIAIPVVAVMILLVRSRGKSRKWKVVLPLAIVAILAAVCAFSPTVRERLMGVSADLVQYAHGHKDTSLGIRLQLYEAALRIIKSHPLFGLGSHGFRDAMPSFAASGLLSPLAADLGKGEVHNQMFAYMTDYGMIGGLALLAVYVVPGVIFWRRLSSPVEPVRRAALMGLAFVVSFWIFGLTVETFDLKITASFYATVVAILAACCAFADSRYAQPEGAAMRPPRSP